MKYKFLLFGAGVGSNYGVDAIVFGTEIILRTAFPGCEIWIPDSSWKGNAYKQVLQKTGIIVKNGLFDVKVEYFIRRILERMKIRKPLVVQEYNKLTEKSDYVLSIGGDLYTFANNESNWPFPYPIIDAGNKIIQTGKPYIIWCASVGPFEKAGARINEIVRHLTKCSAIIVREKESYDYLKGKLGLETNLYLAADPAFLMEPESYDESFVLTNDSKKIIAVNFSSAPLEHVYGKLATDEIKHMLIGLSKKIIEKTNAKILFVPHVKSDWKLLYPIYETLRISKPGMVGIIERDIGARKTKWAISQTNVLLTMRFHCSLAGFSTNTPTLVLVSTSKGQKMVNEMYGNLDFAIDIKDMESDSLFDKLNYLLKNEEKIRKRLSGKSAEMKERAMIAGGIIKNIIIDATKKE